MATPRDRCRFNLVAWVLLLSFGLLGFAAIPATAGTPTGAAAIAGPATLTGEVFAGPLTRIARQCSLSISRIQFASAGTATGPYPGTFVVSGSYTLGPVSGTFSPLTSFTETFTITSPSGTVTGTKTEGVASNPLEGGLCEVTGTLPFTTNALPPYQASITTTGGNGTDQGTSSVRIGDLFTPQFTETFTSSRKCSHHRRHHR